MNNKSDSGLPSEGLTEAYKVVLNNAMKAVHEVEKKTGPILHKLIDASSQSLSDLNELSKEESEKIAAYLKRDLINAASYMTEHNKDFKSWLATDISVIENYLLDQFAQAADQTRIELSKLQMSADYAEYHTGEITGPGVLMCDKCGQNLHFHDAAHIPPCPKCHQTTYHRLFCK